VGVVVVGAGEVGDVVTTVVGVGVMGSLALSEVTFCRVTGVGWVVTAVVGTGVTCTVVCNVIDPAGRSVPVPDGSTLLSLPWSARAKKDAIHRTTTKNAMDRRMLIFIFTPKRYPSMHSFNAYLQCISLM
jgi:hypothetical protein